MKSIHFLTLLLPLAIASCTGKTSEADDSDGADSIADAEAPAEAMAAISIPDNAIKGDFDGDRTTEYLWVEFEKDDEGYATTPMTLRSDNPKFDGLVISEGGMGATLHNLGELGNDGRDYLGADIYAMSAWEQYSVYDFKSGRWRESIEPFSIWNNGDEISRVQRTPGKDGYVTIVTNDISDSDNGFDNQYREVRLR